MSHILHSSAHLTRSALCATALGLAALGVAACSPSGPQGVPDANKPVPAAQTTTEAQASPSTTDAAPGGPADSSGTPQADAAGIAVAPRGDACHVGQLRIDTAGETGAAGSTVTSVRFTNTSPAPCTLFGFPGISLVANGGETPLGKPAQRDSHATPELVTLAPGAQGAADLRLSRAELRPAQTCRPTQADGLRVFPPGDTGSVVLPITPVSACQGDVALLTVRPVRAADAADAQAPAGA